MAWGLFNVVSGMNDARNAAERDRIERERVEKESTGRLTLTDPVLSVGAAFLLAWLNSWNRNSDYR